MNSFEMIEKSAFATEGINVQEKLAVLNKSFATHLTPENGIYGIKEILKDNGVIEKIGKNELGHTFKEYYQNGKLFRRREVLGGGQNVTIEFDDNGIGYLRTVVKLDNHKAKVLSRTLAPNTTIVKGNFTAVTDAYGRPVLNKVTDLQLNPEKRVGVTKFRDSSYRPNDEAGHLIAHYFDGPSSKENIVAQLDHVNRSKMKRVENIVEKLKKEGHTVDYEIKSNYVGSKDTRPSSFEPKITVDGSEYMELPDDLKKIYNDKDVTIAKKAVTTAGEKFGIAHEVGMKSGLVAAGITLTVSTVDNVGAFVDGEISAEEMAVEIAKDTGTAGALGYGTAFVTTAVSQAMSQSSSVLIKRVGVSCLPAAVVSFAVDSYDSISDFAQGKIDGVELSYELGESAASVSGSFVGLSAGAKVGAVIGTAVAGPAGTAVGGAVGGIAGVAGGIAGGVVGCAVASEVYATAVELGAEGAHLVAEQAEKLARDTVQMVQENIPEKLDDVKAAFHDFISSNNLPFHI